MGQDMITVMVMLLNQEMEKEAGHAIMNISRKKAVQTAPGVLY
jgi:hypothetical protein